MAGGTRLPGPRAVLGERRPGSGCRPRPDRRGGGGLLDVGSDGTRSLPSAEPSRARARPHRLGWQPSRFLADRAEAERAFQLAERLGSINATAQQLGTTWPSLRKAFTRHGLGGHARNREAVRQRALAAAGQQGSAPTAPTLAPLFVALNPGQLPTRRGPQTEQGYGCAGPRRSRRSATAPWWNSTPRAGWPQRRVATIARRPQRAQRLVEERAGRAEGRQADRASRTHRTHQQEREMGTDAR
jgi:hypothetical protein